MAYPLSGTLSVVLGDGHGGFRAQRDYATTFDAGLGVLVTGDFNGDHNVDFAVESNSDSSIFVLLGIGHGGFAAATEYFVGEQPFPLAVGDFNGDGCADLAMVIVETGSLQFLWAAGDGGFLAPASYEVGMGSMSAVGAGTSTRTGWPTSS